MPRCDCGDPLKPDVVLFGEYLPGDAIERAQRARGVSADLLLCIGSSLEVYPVAQLPEVTLGAGGKVAIVTKGPTPFDRVATVRLDGDVVDELDALLRALGLRSHRRAGPERGLDPPEREHDRLEIVLPAARPASAVCAVAATGSRCPRSSTRRSASCARRAGSPPSSASAASSATSSCRAASR